MSALGVLIDGAPLPVEEARAFWKRFSDWMEEHRSDLAGFARAEGLASVHPEMHAGGPVLVASRTAPQRPYAIAAKKAASGSLKNGSLKKERPRPPTRPGRPTRGGRQKA